METNQIIDAAELTKGLVDVRAFPLGGIATTVDLSNEEQDEQFILANLSSGAVRSDVESAQNSDRWSKNLLTLVGALYRLFYRGGHSLGDIFSAIPSLYSESEAQLADYPNSALVEPQIEGESQLMIHPQFIFGARPMPQVDTVIRVTSNLVTMIPRENLGVPFRIDFPEDSDV